MKKTLMGFAALTLILVSCSKSEVVDDINSGRGLIIFGAITGKVSTKAAETVLTNLQTNGVSVFALTKALPNGVTYSAYFTDTLTHSENVWTPSIKRYLKDKVKNEFYSIYPSQTGYTAAPNLILPNDAGVGFDYTVGTNADVDLLGAAAKGDYTVSTDGTTGVSVALPFNHLLSQVNLGVKNNIAELGDVKITDISFNNVGAKGSYKFGTEGVGVTNWTADAASPRSTFKITDIIDTKNDAPETVVTNAYLPGGNGDFTTAMAASSLMPMPLGFITESTITFKFRAYDLEGIEVTNGETEGIITLQTTTTWKQGLRYIYVVDFESWFKNRLLKFSVESSGWENHDSKTTDKGIVEVPFN